LGGGNAHVDGGDLLNPLPFVGTVIYALGQFLPFKISTANIRPTRPPFFRFGLLVPVGGVDSTALILPLLWVIAPAWRARRGRPRTFRLW
jgi:hypothetical protein